MAKAKKRVRRGKPESPMGQSERNSINYLTTHPPPQKKNNKEREGENKKYMDREERKKAQTHSEPRQ